MSRTVMDIPLSEWSMSTPSRAPSGALSNWMLNSMGLQTWHSTRSSEFHSWSKRLASPAYPLMDITNLPGKSW
eukprot:CAMPEP_0115312756 /NCGR_PEP_ID=MMETSP0270-20121206/76074_1 /TAXON_ID=71861 /ORGANISM="Scrippsiella trochoidea, Strain CCMP3099" /LENGTH=72 /DNA_ID=CAMNT_0002731747 /DNA_START=61 /DNA_END=276 /DNA_ORIENTATION=-